MENEKRTCTTRPTETKRVCVIGAGAAGLCAARHLAKDSNVEFQFVVFEKSNTVGGTWVYTDRIGQDDKGLPIHSSMYKNLRTNLPKEIMCFPDYPEIKGGDESCVSHAVISDYLDDYAEHFKLKQYIKFNTLVKSIRFSNDNSKWMVKVKDIKNSNTEEYTFDAIMVCNGHYFDPYIPPIQGLSNFKGRVIHSHDYRKPENFVGQKVLVLGASSSGVDIALELSNVVSRVYLSHNNSRLSDCSSLPSSVTEIQGIDRFEFGEFVLHDNNRLKGDDIATLILCTGYRFSYPFLETVTCGLQVDDNFVNPLYKHFINARQPSMCLVGVPMLVVPFPMFHMQVQYFLSVLKGMAKLPTTTAMLEDSSVSMRTVTKKRHAHKFLADTQWTYNDQLAYDGGFEPLPKFYKRGYEIWTDAKRRNLKEYKNFRLRVGSLDGKNTEII